MPREKVTEKDEDGFRVERLGYDPKISKEKYAQHIAVYCTYIYVYMYILFPQTVWLTLGVLTVVVKGRGARSRWRTEFVAIYVLSCLDVQFSW